MGIPSHPIPFQPPNVAPNPQRAAPDALPTTPHAQVHYGGGLGFYRGDVLELLEDIQELQPTVFPSVPRLWNRIYDKVMAQVGLVGFTSVGCRFLGQSLLEGGLWNLYDKVMAQVRG